MQKIYQTYKKLLDLFYKNKTDSNNKNHNNYIFGISLRLNKDGHIDILCELPETEKLNNENIINISEKYAEVLLYMNKGLFKHQIISILNNHKHIYNHIPNSILFIDNVLSFYKLLEIEFNKIKKQKTNPLVRPISVFKIQ